MRFCDSCGKELNDNGEYCTGCGAAYSIKGEGSLQVLDEESITSGKNRIENIEKRIADYYNNTYGGSESGKYVVLHRETTVSEEVCNVIVRYQVDNDGSDDSNNCTPIADVSVNMITGDIKIHSRAAKKKVKRTGAHRFICITAILVMLNIFFIPFLSDKYGLIVDEGERVRAHTFADMIENLGDGHSSDDEMPIDGLYYIGGAICALFIFICALGKNSGACAVGSVGGIILSLYLFYQLYLGTTRWYIGLSDAHLTFGYYISCFGFISMLIASLSKERE